MSKQFDPYCEIGAKVRLTVCPPEARQGIRPELPVLMARGNAPGPALLVTAGQHGRELHGIAAIARLFDALDPAELKGTLVLLPILNPPAVWMRKQDYPNELGRYVRGIENTWNMNRVWGQNADTWTGQVAGLVWERFGRYADAIIDLHGWLSQSQAWGGSASRDLLLAFGVKANAINDTDFSNYPGMLEAQSYRNGKPHVSVELAPQNEIDPAVTSVAERGLWNVMRHLEMLPGTPDLPDTTYLVGEHHELRSSACGLCEPLVKIGDKVDAGQLLARLWSLADLTLIEEFRAPIDGLVHVVIGAPCGEDAVPSAVVDAGQLTIMMREIEKIFPGVKQKNP